MDQDNITALCEAGDKYAVSGCYAKAMQCWFLAAEDVNDYKAKFRLGYCYFKGNEFVKKDMFRAIYWLKQASKKGSYETAKTLGEYYDSLAYNKVERFVDDLNNQQLSIWDVPQIEIVGLILDPFLLKEALVYYYEYIINLGKIAFESSFDENMVINAEEFIHKAEVILNSNKQDEMKIINLKRIIRRFNVAKEELI